jgi:hypothetical protein
MGLKVMPGTSFVACLVTSPVKMIDPRCRKTDNLFSGGLKYLNLSNFKNG